MKEDYTGAFDHLNMLELVRMRKSIKDANLPEDKEFLKALDAEIKRRAEADDWQYPSPMWIGTH